MRVFTAAQLPDVVTQVAPDPEQRADDGDSGTDDLEVHVLILRGRGDRPQRPAPHASRQPSAGLRGLVRRAG